LTSKPAATISGGLTSKPPAMVFAGLTSKLVAMVFFSLTSKLVAMISPSLASKPNVDFLVEPQNQCGRGFSGLSLKTGSSGLVIYALKSRRRFFCLCLKIKWTLVCRLRHKIDGEKSVRVTYQDLAACFT
jgi:hypothetical protein